jgi:hypothetical protein
MSENHASMPVYIRREDVVPAIGACEAPLRQFGRADFDSGIVGGAWSLDATVDGISEGGLRCWIARWWVNL